MTTKSWFELFFIVLAILGFNAGEIVPSFSGFDIILACLCMLVWAMIVLTSEDRFNIERFGLTLILLRVVVPIVGLIITWISHSEVPEPPPPASEAKAETIATVRRIECSSVWYGHFAALSDTLVRIKYNGRDVEIRNRVDTLEVVWLDSCAYRVSKPNSVLELYRILQIHDSHVQLEKMKTDFKKQIVVQRRIR